MAPSRPPTTMRPLVPIALALACAVAGAFGLAGATLAEPPAAAEFETPSEALPDSGEWQIPAPDVGPEPSAEADATPPEPTPEVAPTAEPVDDRTPAAGPKPRGRRAFASVQTSLSLAVDQTPRESLRQVRAALKRPAARRAGA